MSAALDARGLKRVCSECGGRFYDFNKRPIVCPACETEYTGEMKVKARRGRATEVIAEATKEDAKKPQVEAEDELEEEVEVEDIVSLDDDAAVIDDDVKVKDDDDEDSELASIDDDELGDLGKDLGDIDAGVDLDEDDDDLDADLSDVKKVSGSDD